MKTSFIATSYGQIRTIITAEFINLSSSKRFYSKETGNSYLLFSFVAYSSPAVGSTFNIRQHEDYKSYYPISGVQNSVENWIVFRENVLVILWNELLKSLLFLNLM